MLTPKVRATTANFYKFWTEWQQLHVSSRDTVDITVALVNQSSMAFGMALECQVALVNIKTRNKASMDKLASIEEEIKKLRAEAEAVDTQTLKMLLSWNLPWRKSKL